MANPNHTIPHQSHITPFGVFYPVDVPRAPPGPPAPPQLQLRPNPNPILRSAAKRRRTEDKENQNQIPFDIASVQPPLVSPQLRKLLDELGVPNYQNPTHFFTWDLYKTDVNKVHDRLAIPCNQLFEHFLNEQEEAHLQQRDSDGNLNILQVRVIDDSLVVHTMNLCRWDYEKPKNSDCSWSYALTHGWMKLVNSNGLTEWDTIEVWSFRFSDNSLGFIISKGGIVSGLSS